MFDSGNHHGGSDHGSGGHHGHDAGHHASHGDVASHNNVSVHAGGGGGTHGGGGHDADYSCHAAVVDYQQAVGQLASDYSGYVGNVVDHFEFGSVAPVAQDVADVIATDTQMDFYCNSGG